MFSDPRCGRNGHGILSLDNLNSGDMRHFQLERANFPKEIATAAISRGDPRASEAARKRART